MKEAKVWYSHPWIGSTQVRFTRGEALDAGGNVDGACEGTLHYEGDLDGLLKVHSVVYRFSVGGLCSHFYFSKEELKKMVEECGYAEHSPSNLEVCDIWPALYEAVELPVTVTMRSGDRGLYCRMNLHPELDGKSCKGKVYFVDRSCVDKICEGPAVITAVKDKGTYGFVIGHMKQYVAPTDAQVADYVVNNNLYNETVQFCSNKFGSFVLLNGLCFIQEDGEMCLADRYLPGYDYDFDVTESFSGADLVCQGYQGCSYEDFKSKFVRFGFDKFNSIKCSEFISDLLDEAEYYGFISHQSIYNVSYFDVIEKCIPNVLDQFSKDEMTEIISVVNKVNTAANEAIKSKIKSGKLPVLRRL